jgi:hypothetical protein
MSANAGRDADGGDEAREMGRSDRSGASASMERVKNESWDATHREDAAMEGIDA